MLGFSLSDIRETVDSNDEDVVVLRFANEHRVAIDVSVQDDGIMVSELLKETAEENQTRKILEILNESKDLAEAKEKVKALLNK